MMYADAHFDEGDTLGAWFDPILGSATQAGIGIFAGWLQSRSQPSD